MTLNQHGAACRCLLRVRENAGLPGLSDAGFIARFLPRFPDWEGRPGFTDDARLLTVAHELNLAGAVSTVSAYDEVLAAHRAGLEVLVETERAPDQRLDATVRRYCSLLVAMDESGFTLWCPYPSGHSENLPRAARVWWDRWVASGRVLHPPVTAATN